MLLTELRKLNPKASFDTLAAITGLTETTLYRINRYPNDHRMKLDTLIKIYEGTKKTYGTGITPDKYLKYMPFKIN